MACGAIDHWHPAMGRPGQVEVDLVSGHVGEFWKKDLNSHATVPTLKGGPNKALPLRAVMYWAHSLEWVQIKGGSISHGSPIPAPQTIRIPQSPDTRRPAYPAVAPATS